MELLELGLQVLKIPDYTVDASHTDNTMIQTAAYRVIRAWRDQQRTGQEAYRMLYAGLQEDKWLKLASDLQMWVEGELTEGTTDLPPKRKLTCQDLSSI